MLGQTDDNLGLRRIAKAVIVQAGRDAKRGDIDALEWLTSDTCAFYCEYGGVNFKAVYDWAVNSKDTERVQ